MLLNPQKINKGVLCRRKINWLLFKLIMINIHTIRSLLLFSCLLVSVKCSRKISCTINPGLDFSQEEANISLVHIISEGEEDVMHFVWSTYKLPSVIVASTAKNTTLLINSTKLLTFEKDAIIFEGGSPLDIIGVTFSKLLKFKYNNDSSPIKDPLSAEDLDLQSFDWAGINETLNCTNSFASLILKGRNNESLFSKNGALDIQFSVSAHQELSDVFPRIFFTGNSTLLKFVLNNFYSNATNSRYGFEISQFSELSKKCEREKWETIITKSINDEVSPGVFSDVELRAPCSDVTHHKGAFVSWRPVAYTGEEPIVANTSDITITSDLIIGSSLEIQSIAELYFQDRSNATIFNVTFGTPGDGFYIATKYTAWTLMIGTGSVVEMPLSTLVIVLASVGIGLLALFFVTGSIFILYNKCKERDDDLLLN